MKPHAIEIDPNQNPRDMTSAETLANIRELKESIRNRGVDIPIQVRYDTKTGVPTLVHGQCRVMACRELWDEGRDDIFIPSTKVTGDEAERILINLTANSGLPLHEWEFGRAAKTLIKYGRSADDIAAATGKPVRYITEALALADAPIEVKKMVDAAEVTPAHALYAIKEHGTDRAADALRDTVAQAPANAPRPLPRPKAPGISQRALALADDLATAMIEGGHPWDEMVEMAHEYRRLRSRAEG